MQIRWRLNYCYYNTSSKNPARRAWLHKYMDGSKKKVDYIIGDGFVRVNVSEFAPGTYFIVVDGKKMKFSVIK